MLPHQDIRRLPDELNKQLMNDFKGEKLGFVQVGPQNWLLPEYYSKFADDYYNFEVRPDDVWIVTYPRTVLKKVGAVISSETKYNKGEVIQVKGDCVRNKYNVPLSLLSSPKDADILSIEVLVNTTKFVFTEGTTLTQELIWLIQNNFDIEKTKKVSLLERFPFIDITFLIPPHFIKSSNDLSANTPQAKFAQQVIPTENAFHEQAKSLPSPRFIKTHLSFSLLPPKLTSTCKVVYLARNPKDVAVSYYYHNRTVKLHDFKGDFPTYWEYFKKELVVYDPYWEHIKEGWERRNEKNVLFLFYEDFAINPVKYIRTVGEFLGKELTDQEVELLNDHLAIDNFRQSAYILPGSKEMYHNKGEANFIRQGGVGKNNEYQIYDLEEDAQKWIDENIKKIPGLKFPQP